VDDAVHVSAFSYLPNYRRNLYLSNRNSKRQCRSSATERWGSTGSSKNSEGQRSRHKRRIKQSIANSELDQRAWIGAAEMSLEPVEVGKPLEDRVTIFNSGKTLATDVVPSIHMRIVPQEWKVKPHLTNAELKVPDTIRKSVRLMIPGASYQSIIRTSRLSTEQDKLNVGNWYTYIWGDLTYQDIFARNHKTAFCNFRKGDLGGFFQCQFNNNAN
jgi:hypothetical protein